MYSIHWITRKQAKQPYLIFQDRVEWMNRQAPLFYGVLAIVSLGLFVSMLGLSPPSLMAALIAGVIAVGYTFPVIPFRGRFRPLREIPFSKVLWISVSYAVLTVFFPLVKSVYWLDPRLWVVFAARFLFIYAITLPFDERDRDMDRDAGLRTLPLRFGERFTYYAAMTAMAGAFCIAFWGVYYFGFPIRYPLSVAAAWMVVMLVILLGRMFPSEWMYSLVLEGSMLIYVCIWIL